MPIVHDHEAGLELDRRVRARIVELNLDPIHDYIDVMHRELDADPELKRAYADTRAPMKVALDNIGTWHHPKLRPAPEGPDAEVHREVLAEMARSGITDYATALYRALERNPDLKERWAQWLAAGRVTGTEDIHHSKPR